MKNKLISMVDFVLGNLTSDASHSCHLIQKYATFLNTPLNLSMFVPCVKVGDKWEVLEEPKNYQLWLHNKDTFKGVTFTDFKLECNQYQKAKENVLFEGFEVIKVDGLDFYKLVSKEMIIEVYAPVDSGVEFLDILDNGLETIQDLIKYKPTLTEQGMIKSGLK